MAKVDWVEVRERLKTAMTRGVKVLKEGSEGVGYVAGQTAHVIQLEFEIHQIKTRIAALFQELGEAVYKSQKTKGNGVGALRHDLELLHESLKKKQAEIKRTHLARATVKPKKTKKK